MSTEMNHQDRKMHVAYVVEFVFTIAGLKIIAVDIFNSFSASPQLFSQKNISYSLEPLESIIN